MYRPCRKHHNCCYRCSCLRKLPYSPSDPIHSAPDTFRSHRLDLTNSGDHRPHNCRYYSYLRRPHYRASDSTDIDNFRSHRLDLMDSGDHRPHNCRYYSYLRRPHCRASDSTDIDSFRSHRFDLTDSGYHRNHSCWGRFPYVHICCHNG